MVSQTTSKHEPIIAADDDASALHEAACALAGVTDVAVTLALADGTVIELPESAVAALRQVVEAMSANRAIVISPVDKQLTPKQAAQMLNVPDDYFESVLKDGDIPFTTSGTRQYIALEDLLVYKRQRDAARREALREMTRLSQEMGFYQPGESDPGIT